MKSILFLLAHVALANQCPNSWRASPPSGRCFKIYSFAGTHSREKGSWAEALGFCAASGTTLGTFYDEAEYLDVETNLYEQQAESLGDCWIGLRGSLRSKQHTWFWIDQEPSANIDEFSFQAFSPRRPSYPLGFELCGSQSTDGWSSHHCSGRDSKLKCFICASIDTDRASSEFVNKTRQAVMTHSMEAIEDLRLAVGRFSEPPVKAAFDMFLKSIEPPPEPYRMPVRWTPADMGTRRMDLPIVISQDASEKGLIKVRSFAPIEGLVPEESLGTFSGNAPVVTTQIVETTINLPYEREHVSQVSTDSTPCDVAAACQGDLSHSNRIKTNPNSGFSNPSYQNAPDFNVHASSQISSGQTSHTPNGYTTHTVTSLTPNGHMTHTVNGLTPRINTIHTSNSIYTPNVLDTPKVDTIYTPDINTVYTPGTIYTPGVPNIHTPGVPNIHTPGVTNNHTPILSNSQPPILPSSQIPDYMNPIPTSNTLYTPSMNNPPVTLPMNNHTPLMTNHTPLINSNHPTNNNEVFNNEVLNISAPSTIPTDNNDKQETVITIHQTDVSEHHVNPPPGSVQSGSHLIPAVDNIEPPSHIDDTPEQDVPQQNNSAQMANPFPPYGSSEPRSTEQPEHQDSSLHDAIKEGLMHIDMPSTGDPIRDGLVKIAVEGGKALLHNSLESKSGDDTSSKPTNKKVKILSAAFGVLSIVGGILYRCTFKRWPAIHLGSSTFSRTAPARLQHTVCYDPYAPPCRPSSTDNLPDSKSF
eukprot:Blabericola_migrator_1__11914@NODE_727_length_6713_cov_119_729461_g523_i0_p1_GENE_NODE_727_length_6713_cov_119_729461_g523_i0NODE_727_length_6713_cov_119_729461_g523_i0_p1_ORF_typecomplete_len754_score107_79Lectin_C/PF00059_21/1_4e08_NODE_727_length_6713_cov_119_729461_g523_i07362997